MPVFPSQTRKPPQTNPPPKSALQRRIAYRNNPKKLHRSPIAASKELFRLAIQWDPLAALRHLRLLRQSQQFATRTLMVVTFEVEAEVGEGWSVQDSEVEAEEPQVVDLEIEVALMIMVEDAEAIMDETKDTPSQIATTR
jgi:hypothetical protein